MASFFAFDPASFQTDAFEQGGTGVSIRRGGWLPWWMRREYMERLLEEERRLARLAARQSNDVAVEEKVATQAEVLLESLQTPATPPSKPTTVAEPPAPKPYEVEKLAGPFQHLLRRPAPPTAAEEFSHDEIMHALDMIDALETLEKHEREMEHA